MAIGAITVDFEDDSWNDAALVAFLNDNGSLAPGGGPAYVAGGAEEDYDESGQIAVTGNGAEGNAFGVTLVRPAYGNFTATASRTVTYGDSN